MRKCGHLKSWPLPAKGGLLMCHLLHGRVLNLKNINNYSVPTEQPRFPGWEPYDSPIVYPTHYFGVVMDCLL